MFHTFNLNQISSTFNIRTTKCITIIYMQTIVFDFSAKRAYKRKGLFVEPNIDFS